MKVPGATFKKGRDLKPGGSPPTCACGARLSAIHFGTRDGICWQWCPSCGLEAPVPVQGERHHDQAAKRQGEMQSSVQRAQTFGPSHESRAGSLGAAKLVKDVHPWKRRQG